MKKDETKKTKSGKKANKKNDKKEKITLAKKTSQKKGKVSAKKSTVKKTSTKVKALKRTSVKTAPKKKISNKKNTTAEIKEKKANIKSAKKEISSEKRKFDETKDISESLYYIKMFENELLSKEEEIELAKEIEARKKLIDKKKKSYTSSEKKIIKKGELAREKLIKCNLRLVVNEANTYVRKAKHLTLDDLVQEGNIGLMKAVERFEYKKGFRFSTYATVWIRQAIGRGIAEKDRLIRIPVHVLENVNKIFRTSIELTKRLGRKPTDKEIANELNMDVKEYNLLRERTMHNTTSFDDPAGKDGDTTIGDIFTDEDEEIDKRVEEFKKKEVLRLFKVLDEREKIILSYRLGLNEENEVKTLDEIGKIINYTRERVRQFEKIALEKLHKEAVERKLDEILGL